MIDNSNTVMQPPPPPGFLVPGSDLGWAHMAAALRVAFTKDHQTESVLVSPLLPFDCGSLCQKHAPPPFGAFELQIIISCMVECYANDPKQQRRFTKPAPALDLTTCLRHDWPFTNGSVTSAQLPSPPSPPSAGGSPPRKAIFTLPKHSISSATKKPRFIFIDTDWRAGGRWSAEGLDQKLIGGCVYWKNDNFAQGYINRPTRSGPKGRKQGVNCALI